MDSVTTEHNGLEWRPYQTRIVRKAIGLLCGHATFCAEAPEPPVESVVIESPTGSGKTAMALGIARWVQEHLGMSVGWCAMRRNLLVQAAAENERWGFGVDLKLISMFEKQPPRVDLLVVDEAQHDGALSMANLHGQIQPKKVLGLTATPFRTDRFKLCFKKTIRDAGIHALIRDGYLSPYHHYTMPAYGPQTVAEMYLRDPDHWGRSLIFFHRLQQCVECAESLVAGGVGAEVVTARTDRQGQIEEFAAGRIPVLINMLILSEGFDCPALKTVFCRPSGRLCTVQMCGRVFRRHPDLPWKQIVQCEQTRHPFGRTARPAEQYLWTDGQWRSLRPNRRLDELSIRMRGLMAASSSARLPQFVVNRRERPGRARFARRRPDETAA